MGVCFPRSRDHSRAFRQHQQQQKQHQQPMRLPSGGDCGGDQEPVMAITECTSQQHQQRHHHVTAGGSKFISSTERTSREEDRRQHASNTNATAKRRPFGPTGRFMASSPSKAMRSRLARASAPIECLRPVAASLCVDH